MPLLSLIFEIFAEKDLVDTVGGDLVRSNSIKLNIVDYLRKKINLEIVEDFEHSLM